VAENPGQSIAVVAHGGVISIYLNYLLRENDFWHRVPRQTALTIIDFNAKDLQVRLINDHSHLKDE
ncbi:MAG: histidine phosphatase family protein, partial [Candidatus Omnitrophica bacterium]|nr:histidine phosphatase family protein [Candidatus Omnitrophota bacterium]